MHFCVNSASPTARASSMTRMSASTCAITANARRTDMPLEYIFTGWSRKVPMSAKAAIESKRWSSSRRVSPRTCPLR